MYSNCYDYIIINYIQQQLTTTYTVFAFYVFNLFGFCPLSLKTIE